MNETEKLRRLKELYPNKHVVDLYKTDHELFCALYDEAITKVLALPECIAYYGFTYERENKYDAIIVYDLYKMYPDNNVDSTYSKNKSLYSKIISRARHFDISAWEYIQSIGFSTPIEHRKYITKKSFATVLKDIYPDGIITSASINENKLRGRLSKQARSRKSSLKDYVNSLGFTYIKSNSAIPKPKLIEELEALYPTGTIENLRSINTPLYKRLSVRASKDGLSMSDFVKKYGLCLPDSRKEESEDSVELLQLYPNKIIDRPSIKNLKIYEEIKTKARAKHLSISDYLQSIGFILKDDTISSQLKDMYPDGIVKNLRVKNFKLYQGIVRKACNEKTTIAEYLESEGFIYEGIGEAGITQELLECYPDKLVNDINRNFYRRIKNLADQKELTVKEYLKCLGFSYRIDDCLPIEEELRRQYPNKVVSGISRALYKRLWTAAKNKDMDLVGYLKTLGFTYERADDSELTKQLEKLYPGKTIAKLDRALYLKIYRIAHKRGTSVNLYLSSIGFVYE